TGTISKPVDNSVYNDLAVIRGSCKDSSPGEIERVEIKIERQNPKGYWTGSGWDVNEVWISTWSSGFSVWVSSWEYVVPGSLLSNAKEYIVVSKAVDKAGNEQGEYAVGESSNSFIWDDPAVGKPITEIKNIVDGQKLNSLTSISGTAEDPYSPYCAGISEDGGGKVELRIEDETWNKWWDGGSWVDVVSTVSASGVSPPDLSEWKYDINSWISDHKYRIRVFGTDNVGNVEDVDSGYVIYYDTTPGSVVIGSHSDLDYVKELGVISGTANGDIAGIDEVEIRISYEGSEGTYYWIGTDWSSWTGTYERICNKSGSEGEVSWSYPGGSDIEPVLSDGTTYTIRVRVRDLAGNEKEWVEADSIKVRCDKKEPVAGITRPLDGSYYRAGTLSTISGTAKDEGSIQSGIDRVDIYIQNITVSPNRYFDGNGWVSVESSVTVSGTDEWIYYDSDLVYDNTTQFKITAYARDKVGNISVSTYVVFIYDDSEPNVGIEEPDSEYERELSVISGTGDDPYSVNSGIDVSGVKVAIQEDPPTGSWWNWVNLFSEVTPKYEAGSYSGGSWSKSSNLPVWEDGKKYRVRVYAEDRSGNTSSVVDYDFVYDSVYSTAEVVYPGDGSKVNDVSEISGTAFDEDSGISEVRIAMRDMSTLLYWNGYSGVSPGSFDSAVPVWGVCEGSVSWKIKSSSYNMLSGRDYRIVVEGIDLAGNDPADPDWGSAPGIEFRYDNEAPEIGISIPVDGTYSNTVLSTISGTGNDTNTGGSGIASNQVKYRIKRSDGKWYAGSGNTWQDSSAWWPTNYTDGDPGEWVKTFSAPYPWEDGYTYDIVVYAEDYAGNVNVTYATSTFIYDTTLPTATITAPVDGGYVSQTGIIKGTCSDTLPGVMDKVKVRIKRGSDGHYWRVSDSSWTMEGAPEVWNEASLSSESTFFYLNTSPWETDETYYVNGQGVDKAGNYQVDYGTITFIADFTPPTGAVVLPADGSEPDYIPTISGTCGDTSPGEVDSQNVYLILKGFSPVEYWSGDIWTDTTTVYLKTTVLSQSTWYYSDSNISWTKDRTYNATVVVYDKAGNSTISIYSSTFTYRAPIPETVIKFPLNGKYYNSLE
ncbi:MAG: hypothetical protein DRJ47_10810, partial [Thermoprotei archaeon]